MWNLVGMLKTCVIEFSTEAFWRFNWNIDKSRLDLLTFIQNNTILSGFIDKFSFAIIARLLLEWFAEIILITSVALNFQTTE